MPMNTNNISSNQAVSLSKTEPLVSIITSTYNRSKLLRRAIESVLAQEYVHWEMCIVGDCTPDDTEAVVASYKDDRLSFYNLQEKSPPGSHGAIAKNHALFRTARGKYIAYLDDDDAYLPGFLKTMVLEAEKHRECPVVYCRAIYRDKDTGKKVWGNPFPSRAHRWSRERLMSYNFLVSNGVLHTRDILDRVGGWNPADYLDDYDLWKRMAAHGDFHYVDRPLCVVYIHEPEGFFRRAIRKGWKIMLHGRRIEDQG